MDNDKNNISAEPADDTGNHIDKAGNNKPAPKKKPKISLKEKITKALREYKSELKKIVWFSREQTFKSSIIVLISVIIVSAFIGGLDFLFSNALLLLGKII